MPAQFRKTARRGSRGQVIPFIALALVALVGMGALAIDVGYWRYQQRIEQSAADSAAIAGAIALAYGDVTHVSSAGQADAATNGFPSANVTVNYPPLSATSPYKANVNAVEAIVTKQQPVFFGSVLGQTSPSVTARAVALVKSSGGGCLYTLDAAGSVTLNAGLINAGNCGVAFNGSVGGSGTVDAGSIAYAGSFTANSNVTPIKTVQASDPCAAIPGCAYLQTAPTPPTAGCLPSPSAGVIAPPGVYCSISVTGNKTLTLNGTGSNPGSPGGCSAGTPGLYYVVNGISAGGNSTIEGCNVTIINLNGSLDLTGGTMDISAPTTGVTKDVAFYQPPSNKNQLTGSGNNAAIAVDGAFYAPTADYTFNGKSDTFTLMMVGSITRNGNKAITLVTDPAMPGVQHAVLAE